MQKERVLTKVNEVPTLDKLGATTTLPSIAWVLLYLIEF
jgi:hypothetical protein